MTSKLLLLLATGLTLATASGAGCPRMLQQYTQPIPLALQPNASKEQVINVVNHNSELVQSLYCSRATVTVPGLPSLRALVAYQRARNFRLRAETAFTGPEVDVGSNNQQFWFWVKRNQPPVLYFCRHDQFAASAAKRVVPIEPDWLIRALGIVTFEPGLQHIGPNSISAGRLEVRTLPTAPGGNTRVTVIDATRGIVLEEHIYDSQGTRLATALMSKHRHDTATGVTLPRHVDLQLPATKLELGLDLNDMQINQLSAAQADLWNRPMYPGYTDLDLADPNLRLIEPPVAGQPPRVPPEAARY